MHVTKKKQEKVDSSWTRLAAIRRLIAKTDENDEQRLEILRQKEQEELRRYKRLCQ